MNMAPRRTAQRQRHKTWPPPPLGGIGRPVSAQPSSRKRAASGTPGSDQASPSSCALICLPHAAFAPSPHTRDGMCRLPPFRAAGEHHVKAISPLYMPLPA